MWKDKLRRMLDRSIYWERRKFAKDIETEKNWRAAGCPRPVPHSIKSTHLRRIARQFRCTTLVETGTCLGEMVIALRHDFASIHTIELSPYLASRAKDRLAWQRHVFVYEADSAIALPFILARTNNRALIWLDAHYSGGVTAKGIEDSPIVKELMTVSKYLGHPIVIDDAHEFVGRNGYPTVDELRGIAQQHFPGYKLSIVDNMIELLPQQ